MWPLVHLEFVSIHPFLDEEAGHRSGNLEQPVVGDRHTHRAGNAAFIYIGGTMYNLTFYLVGGPTVLLSDAWGIDCQGNISAIGTSAAGGTPHSYLLVRQGAQRSGCAQ
jgi:hypothetical protein